LGLPKTFEPEWVAAELVRALRGNRARVLPGGNGLLLWIQRVSPALAARIMNGIGLRAPPRSAQRGLAWRAEQEDRSFTATM
jgi:hypothetical protein